MTFDFAPMEGVTDAVLRRVHFAMFPGISRYYLPFISPTSHTHFTAREKRSLLPPGDEKIPVVPQLLTRSAEDFNAGAKALADEGFTEVNLNLGCPSGTVTAKGKGSAMLRDLGELERFLDAVFSAPPIAVSIKTRVGYESAEDWPGLLEIFSRYPMSRLIVHPRTRAMFYKGHADRSLCDGIPASVHFVYNGDIFTAEDALSVKERFPDACGVMAGRGFLTNPALARETAGGSALTREELRAFHDGILACYDERWPVRAVLGHMHEIMNYMLHAFVAPKKPARLIRKANSLEMYRDAVELLFSEYDMKKVPAYDPDASLLAEPAEENA